MSIIVPLTPSEVLLAANVGVTRRVSSLKRKLPITAQWDHLWEGDIVGAIAEYAFCKGMGLFWNMSVNLGKVEDAAGYHIRSTSHPKGHLLIRKYDLDGRYALVTVHGMTCTIVGYIHTSDAKNERYYKENENTDNGTYWVPQSDLNEMEI